MRLRDEHLRHEPRALPVSAPLPACSMLLLISRGDADVIACPTPEECRSACQKAAPHAELEIIPGAGHMAPWEQPDIFNERVLKFLRHQDPSSLRRTIHGQDEF